MKIRNACRLEVTVKVDLNRIKRIMCVGLSGTWFDGVVVIASVLHIALQGLHRRSPVRSRVESLGKRRGVVLFYFFIG